MAKERQRNSYTQHNLIMKIKKLVTLVKGDPKVPFSIATTSRCTGGHYSIPWIAPLYSWSPTYNAECYARQHQVSFLGLWYDSTWDWTLVSWTIGEHYSLGHVSNIVGTKIHQLPFYLPYYKVSIVFRVNKCLHVSIYPNSPPHAGCNTRSIFKQNTAGLNSEFSFS